MILLVGLGNPGDEYKNNRHNVGFMFADYILKALLLNKEESRAQRGEVVEKHFKYDKYLLSDIAKAEQIILAKPQTFMNRSGDAVKKLTTSYELQTTNLFVAHDDLDISLGNFKIQSGTGPKMHNGISSIEENLKTKEFWRIRIGVDNRNPERRMPGEAYVLENFSADEMKKLQTLFNDVYLQLIQVLKNG